MIICGLNQDVVWENPVANFKMIEEEFSNVQADIFLLPEMFTTGFSMRPERIADGNQSTLNWMQRFASHKNAAICGSVSIMEQGKYFNRMYFVKPDGSYFQYDKRHLFSFSGEDKTYAQGKERIIAEYQGVRFLLQICYDLRFPVFSRNKNDYDVALYVANWPEKRVAAWEHLLKARAIENQAIVFGLNRIGTDGNGLYYPESSYAFFADGEQISTKKENLITAKIDLIQLQSFRKHYDFLRDRDEFEMVE